jgi:hypothetical protein
MRIFSSRIPSTARRTSASSPARNAASVLPDPVGAMISVSAPVAISAQPSDCASVGAPKRPANQLATIGWNIVPLY